MITTLLNEIVELDGSEMAVIAEITRRLECRTLTLRGNFRGCETEILAQLESEGGV
jgi:hypothetical protein